MYLLALRETLEGKRFHITRFLACQNELREPLPNNRRELKAVPTDRKVLSPLDFLAYSWFVFYSTMEKNELPAILSWTYYNDGTSDPPPLPKSEPSQEPKEPPKYDYDKLIAESTGLYRDWWILWKRIHPEWALLSEEPKEPIIKAPLKPKVTFKPLSCKRCNHTWTPRSKEPPVQCPKCHSPYWNREKVKH